MQPKPAGLVEERQRLGLEEVRHRKHGEAEEVDQQQRAEHQPLAGAAKLLGRRGRELALRGPDPDEGHDGDGRGDDQADGKLYGVAHVNDGHGDGQIEHADEAAHHHSVATRAPEVQAGHQQAERRREDDGGDDVAGERRERAAPWDNRLLRALHPDLGGVQTVDQVHEWVGDGPDDQQRHAHAPQEAHDAVQIDRGHEALATSDHHRQQPEQDARHGQHQRDEEQHIANPTRSGCTSARCMIGLCEGVDRQVGRHRDECGADTHPHDEVMQGAGQLARQRQRIQHCHKEHAQADEDGDHADRRDIDAVQLEPGGMEEIRLARCRPVGRRQELWPARLPEDSGAGLADGDHIDQEQADHAGAQAQHGEQNPRNQRPGIVEERDLEAEHADADRQEGEV